LYAEYGPQGFVPIVYHISDALANQWSNQRMSYYGVNATPWTCIDGVRVGNYNYSGLKPFVQSRYSTDRPMTINVTAVYNKTTQMMKITTTVKLTSDIADGSWYIRPFVTENSVNGSYNYVLRQMDSSELTIRSTNQEQKYEWEFQPGGWTIENLMAGAFVQNDSEKFTTYNIYQGALVTSITITNDVATTSFGIIKAMLR